VIVLARATTAEDFGINPPSVDVGTLRTANRTSNCLNKDLSSRIAKRFDFDFILEAKSEKENNADYDGAEFHGLEVGEFENCLCSKGIDSCRSTCEEGKRLQVCCTSWHCWHSQISSIQDLDMIICLSAWSRFDGSSCSKGK